MHRNQSYTHRNHSEAGGRPKNGVVPKWYLVSASLGFLRQFFQAEGGVEKSSPTWRNPSFGIRVASRANLLCYLCCLLLTLVYLILVGDR
jgi:hypothetical protein